MSLLWRISTMLLTSLIEKFAVVRNHQDRAGIVLQIFLKPEQRFEVEMVGRFVEQQQVRLLHEQPRQVRAHDPAAAHFARLAGRNPFRESQAGQNLLRLGFELIAAEFVETVVHVVVDFLADPASTGWSASQALMMRRSLANSGVMAVASSSTVSSPAGALSCGR